MCIYTGYLLQKHRLVDQTNTDHSCPLKWGNTQPEFTFGSQWHGFNMTNIEDLIKNWWI